MKRVLGFALLLTAVGVAAPVAAHTWVTVGSSWVTLSSAVPVYPAGYGYHGYSDARRYYYDYYSDPYHHRHGPSCALLPHHRTVLRYAPESGFYYGRFPRRSENIYGFTLPGRRGGP
jgi:hypothetical protein